MTVEMRPARIPDLYLGEPVWLTAAFDGSVDCAVVSGRRGDESWRGVLPVDRAEARPGIGVLWARHEIASLMDHLRIRAGHEEIRSAVIAIALDHHVVSKYTNLVAVDVKPGTHLDAPPHTAAVPTNLPHGWQYEAVFSQLPQTATTGPLHAILGLVAVVLAALLWWLRPRASAPAPFAGRIR